MHLKLKKKNLSVKYYIALIQPFTPKDPVRTKEVIFVYSMLDLSWPLIIEQDKPL